VINGLFNRGAARQPGWLAISVLPGEMHFAHGMGGERGRCVVKRCGTEPLENDKQLERMAKELGFARHQCLALLPATDYQMLLVEAPNVPALELKTAVRWRIKDMLDYHVQDATIDVLDIPVESSAGRSHSMYAVAARNDIIQACIERFTAAHIPLSVIDIAETAQRNIARLFETEGQGLAFLMVEPRQALLTVNYRGELYLARRIDIGIDDLYGEGREDALARMALELQRSFDHFDRQFPQLGIAKLMLAPEQGESGLAAFLDENLDQAVEQARLSDVLEIEGTAAFEEGDSWRLFHLLGASLRSEAKAL